MRWRPEPDAAVTTAPFVGEQAWPAPQEVLPVVEVESPESRIRDRTVKPHKYAEAGIGLCRRVEQAGGKPVEQRRVALPTLPGERPEALLPRGGVAVARRLVRPARSSSVTPPIPGPGSADPPAGTGPAGHTLNLNSTTSPSAMT
ncbi:Uma2 family endonuclease [Saccharothrix xinjiangensis]|uniref:Uma2 family endonuclease n=1 Tax=Saccharothrix xinjiangensis TaxID=204798 RepID=A0ABV9Y0X8_9PSEU